MKQIQYSSITKFHLPVTFTLSDKQIHSFLSPLILNRRSVKNSTHYKSTRRQSMNASKISSQMRNEKKCSTKNRVLKCIREEKSRNVKATCTYTCFMYNSDEWPHDTFGLLTFARSTTIFSRFYFACDSEQDTIRSVSTISNAKGTC